MATSRRKPPSRTTLGPRRNANGNAQGATDAGGPPRLPTVRLAPREELAAAARVAPLMRAARDVARWIGPGRALTKAGRLRHADALAATTHLELIPAEFEAAWRVAVAARLLVLRTGEQGPGQHGVGRAETGDRLDVLASGTADEVLAAWDAALTVMLEAEDLDGMATALYTVGGPVRMDALFDAYLAAADTRRRAHGGQPGPGGDAATDPGLLQDEGAALSVSLEMLADLGVVELGADGRGRRGRWRSDRHPVAARRVGCPPAAARPGMACPGHPRRRRGGRCRRAARHPGELRRRGRGKRRSRAGSRAGPPGRRRRS